MQFIDSTADQYGVNQHDADSAINGAAKYIKDLLEMYSGDTEMAVAAYNMGQGNLNRVLNKAMTENKTWQELIPAETKNYIAEWKKWTGKKTKVAESSGTAAEEYIKKYGRK
jgi:soluble lytic murein transglycosylase-like protein